MGRKAPGNSQEGTQNPSQLPTDLCPRNTRSCFLQRKRSEFFQSTPDLVSPSIQQRKDTKHFACETFNPKSLARLLHFRILALKLKPTQFPRNNFMPQSTQPLCSCLSTEQTQATPPLQKQPHPVHACFIPSSPLPSPQLGSLSPDLWLGGVGLNVRVFA